MKLKFKKLHPNAVLPSYSKEGDGALDLVATSRDQIYLDENRTDYYDEVGFGLSIEIPEGYVGLLFPRSSISNKMQYLTNSVGVIDSNFRGELKARFKPDTVALKKHIYARMSIDSSGFSKAYFTSNYMPGDRAIQLIVIPIPKLEPEFVEELSETNRGSQGFGSSGQ